METGRHVIRIGLGSGLFIYGHVLLVSSGGGLASLYLLPLGADILQEKGRRREACQLLEEAESLAGASAAAAQRLRERRQRLQDR